MTIAYEVNFDGLVGPTHHYAGLPQGNMASQKNAYMTSNPKAAALQGLEKMWFLAKLGLKQAILPPAPRPQIAFLQQIGFIGDEASILAAAFKTAPRAFAASYSASSMWTANAATVSPSADTQDGRVHMTPANLISHCHRSLETAFTQTVLKTIFADPHYFVHHDALPANAQFTDEGAANHTRLTGAYAEPGVEFFVYGKQGFIASTQPAHFPARQTYEASEAIARLHQLTPKRVVYAQQSPEAIDAGAFHNDVVCVGNANVLLYHENAFLNPVEVAAQLQAASSYPIHFLAVPATEISLMDTVNSYLFNSQLITLPNQEMALITPSECEEMAAAKAVITRLISEDNPIKQAYSVDCRQSMQNGGGPACLRLRVVLTAAELAAVQPGVFLDETLYIALKEWISRYYRDSLIFSDLQNPSFVLEVRTALDRLTQLLKLGNIYDFQH